MTKTNEVQLALELLCEESFDSFFQQSYESSSPHCMISDNHCDAGLLSEFVNESCNFLCDDGLFMENCAAPEKLNSGYSCSRALTPYESDNARGRRPEVKSIPFRNSSFGSSTSFLTCSEGLSAENSLAKCKMLLEETPIQPGTFGRNFSGEQIAMFEFRQSISNLLENENSPLYRRSKDHIERLKGNSLGNCVCKQRTSQTFLRRKGVHQIIKLKENFQLSIGIAAHAVYLLDKFLSTQGPYSHERLDDLLLAASACLWIAAKFEDSRAPGISAFQVFSCSQFVEESMHRMEVIILKSMGWFAATVTASDFIDNIINQFPHLGVPRHLMGRILERADELVQGILPEAEIMAYQPSTISMCVVRCILDEYVPLQATSHRAALQKAMAIDMDEVQSCYQTLVDLVVDPHFNFSIPSPSHIAEINNKALSTH